MNYWDTDPYSDINWVKRKATIVNSDGTVRLDKEAEFPDYMTDTAVSVITDKYLYNSARPDGIPSLKTLINRVSEWIGARGMEQGYFTDDAECGRFVWWLKFIQGHQLAGFNSPVYFNAGSGPTPQLSACFINGMKDTMASITDLAVREATIFKNGSGSGVDYSVLRSSREPVQEAGCASGPVSFLRVHDTLAGEIKSAGVVRRSARMAVLDVNHGDIFQFVTIKRHEEEKLLALENAGIVPFRGNTRLSDEVSYQNTNLSVRMDAGFLQAVEDDADWKLLARDGSVLEVIRARKLMDAISDSAWASGEPGVHFGDNINEWNTVPHAGPINASNPCSEFMFIDDSACNLAAINLLGFELDMHKHSGAPDMTRAQLMEKVVETMITAQDIIVDASVYPNDLITSNSHNYRPLGLGFTNLAAVLMYLRRPYDSDVGRKTAASYMEFISRNAHKTSVALAIRMGAYNGWDADNHAYVIRKHAEAAKELYGLDDHSVLHVWESMMGMPIRNAQLTLLAPCGTMGYILDNASTGIEPFFFHVSYKNLVGGGTLKLTNPFVARTLESLGYTSDCFNPETGEFSSAVSPSDLDIFKTARDMSWHGHLKMMAAVQPFISGSISKCVTGDTLIPTEKGLIRIGSLAGQDQMSDTYRDLVMKVASIAGPQLTSKIYKGGVRPCKTVRLVDGREITGTFNHRVMIESSDGKQSWQYLDSIKKGDRVLVKLTDMWNESAPDYDIDEVAKSIRTGNNLPDHVLAGNSACAYALYNKLTDSLIECEHKSMAIDLQAFFTNLGQLSLLYRRGDVYILDWDNSYAEELDDNTVSIPVYEVLDHFDMVYDFCVPVDHAFVGNGMVNHNTVNMSSDVTPQEIAACYAEAHRLGLKSVIVYRDGSKSGQVLTSKLEGEKANVEVSGDCVRRILDDNRPAWNHKFKLNGGVLTGYLNVGEFPDGSPGELFLRMAKEGSTMGGLFDAFATLVSIALQYNVPLEDLVSKMLYRRFEPAGMTSNPNIPMTTSVVDYIFRFLGQRYLSTEKQAELGILPPARDEEPLPHTGVVKRRAGDGVCPLCGSALIRLGSCTHCPDCAWNSGSCS